MAYVAVLLIFFISGIIALGYQVLWSKYLLVFIGVGSYSYATVLAAFMSGLALGSWLIGKLVDRIRSPLKLYAYLELGIGIYALGYPHLTDLAASMYGSAVQFTSEQAGGSVGLGMKIFVSALLLLLPTTLMGGTYPALLRHVTQNMQSLGKRASQLYSINAFGAVAGSLFMAFVFMPTLGMSASLMLLATCNAFIALLAFLLSGFSKAEPESVPSTPESSISFYSPRQLRLGYWLIFLEGFLAFVYEIGWTRCWPHFFCEYMGQCFRRSCGRNIAAAATRYGAFAVSRRRRNGSSWNRCSATICRRSCS
jgi:spermidine synthase